MPSKNIAIVGAGPAGLRAAEVAAERGAKVTVYDAKPSSGRKFLVAGKSGLNLTNDDEWQAFLSRYTGNDLPTEHWNHILTKFDNTALRAWAASLGIATYTASSGKVFPTEMKSAPLLRRWIEKLRRLEVSFHHNHQLIDLTNIENGATLTVKSKDVESIHDFDSIILALGGGSWQSTGSDGSWLEIFNKHGIQTTPLTAANCGWHTHWHPSILEKAEGLPLKNIVVTAGENSRQGELVITKYGLEGGPIYRLGRYIKALESPQITIDFKPSFTIERLVAKMESAKRNLLHEAKLRWKLSPAVIAILDTYPEWTSVEQLAKTVKACTLTLTHTRPIGEAISSAGGVKWSELDQNLMLKTLPHIYCAGEMLDWEAPTGGYLLQACFATGNWAGHQASQGINTP